MPYRSSTLLWNSPPVAGLTQLPGKLPSPLPDVISRFHNGCPRCLSQTLRNSTASSLILTNFCVSPFPAKIEIELISLDARGRDRKRQGWTLSFRCKGIFHSIGKPTWLPMEGDEVTWTGGGTPAQCSPANYDISRVAPHCS